MNMIERVAEASYHAFCVDRWRPDSIEADIWRTVARAAIKAMSNPNIALHVSAETIDGEPVRCNLISADVAWNDVIDMVLKEGE